jgi:hypothetical protein
MKKLPPSRSRARPLLLPSLTKRDEGVRLCVLRRSICHSGAGSTASASTSPADSHPSARLHAAAAATAAATSWEGSSAFADSCWIVPRICESFFCLTVHPARSNIRCEPEKLFCTGGQQVASSNRSCLQTRLRISELVYESALNAAHADSRKPCAPSRCPSCVIIVEPHGVSHCGCDRPAKNRARPSRNICSASASGVMHHLAQIVVETGQRSDVLSHNRVVSAGIESDLAEYLPPLRVLLASKPKNLPRRKSMGALYPGYH